MYLAVIVAIMVALPILECSPECSKRSANLTLRVEGVRNATGYWERHVQLDFDGPRPPQTWDIDFQEITSTETEYVFAATAKVTGVTIDCSNATTTGPNEMVPTSTHIYRGDIRNYTDASKVCQDLGGHLAVINSEAEAEDLKVLVNKSRDERSTISLFTYLGFNDIETEGFFVTVLGTTLKEAGYEKWAPNEPNNLRFQVPNGTLIRENCGSMNVAGLLNDSACHIRLPYICEFNPSSSKLTTANNP